MVEKLALKFRIFGIFVLFIELIFLIEPALARQCSSTEILMLRQELAKAEPDRSRIDEVASCPEAVQYSLEVLKFSESSTAHLYSSYLISISGADNISFVLNEILYVLRNIERDDNARRYLIVSIGNSGQANSDAVAALIDILKADPNGENRGAAALALGDLQHEPEKSLPSLIDSFNVQHPGNKNYVYEKAAISIGAFGVDGKPYLQDLKSLLKSANYDPKVRLAIAGAIADISLAMYEQSTSQADSTIKITDLRKVWISSRQLRLLSNELADNLNALKIQNSAIPELTDIYGEVERYKELVDNEQQDLALSLARQSFGGFSQIAITHGLVWLALIFAYPRSPMVQTAFFWNPRIRRILGFPYVTATLKWAPFFRDILFVPFRDALRSDANLDLFKGQTYFADLNVKAEGWSESLPINQVIPGLKGQILLQGESGSGKSMFLRHLLSQSSRIAVYLPAQKCAQGVIAAIQAKLYGQAQDADFLRDLIYSGALDIYIDGLNEVTPDTRASIKEFVEKNFKGNIILTTQPLEWQPPGQVYNLQPLRMEQISNFLQQHRPNLATEPATYSQNCENYLQSVQANLISENIPADEKVALRQSLSNPMDLTVVAQLIASEKWPNLLRLREQQYTTMTEDYQRIYLGRSFPLGAFADLAYQLRIESQVQIPESDFNDELLCLERHKMVVRRQKTGEGGNWATQWFFRHEKIADFFVAQSFLKATDDRQTKHFADSRFRGVYLLLATLLPEPQKMALREQLIQYGAKHNDHVLSDAFIQMVGSPELPKS